MSRSRPPRTCERCGRSYTPHPKAQAQRYCSHYCSAAARRIRAALDERDARNLRERTAPGLSRRARTALLRRMQARGHICLYCGGPPETLDHVVPLVRGGTNHEGNLAPACRRCNGGKGGLLVVEWRTGRRLPRMTEAVPVRRHPRPARLRPIRLCPICDQPSRKGGRYCGDACYAEAHSRQTRERYRTRNGLAPTPERPTTPRRPRPEVGSNFARPQ